MLIFIEVCKNVSTIKLNKKIHLSVFAISGYFLCRLVFFYSEPA